jgi:hypothetical protein
MKIATEPAAPNVRRALFVGTLAAVVALAVTHAAVYGTPIFPVDDAYITLHNAVALKTGSDPNYNDIPALVGSTSAIHVVLVAALLYVLKPVWALWVSCWIGAALYALGLLRVASVHKASTPVALGIVVAGLIVAQTPHQLSNGLETGLAMAGVTWALALASEPDAFDRRDLPILLGMLPFLRPELAALSGLMIALVVRDAIRASRRREAIVFASLALAGALPWLLLYWASTGLPFPNTVQAKRFFFAEGCAPAAVKLGTTLNLVGLFSDTLGYVSRAAFLLLFVRLGRLGLAFALVLVAMYFLNLPGALGHYEQRYLYILVPFFFYGIAAAARHPSPSIRLIAAGFLVIGLDESVWRMGDRWRYHLATCGFTRDELAPVADWTRANLPAESRLMIHDAGYISWATQFQLVDMVGLKTPSSVDEHRRLTWQTCASADRSLPLREFADKVNGARVKAIAELALHSRPTHLVILGGWERLYGIVRGLQTLGWEVQPVRDAPLGYDVYRLAPPR